MTAVAVTAALTFLGAAIGAYLGVGFERWRERRRQRREFEDRMALRWGWGRKGNGGEHA